MIIWQFAKKVVTLHSDLWPVLERRPEKMQPDADMRL